MGRRSTPERLYQAKRAAIVARLQGEGWPRADAEDWCGRWEAEGDRQGKDRAAGDFWQRGAAWIAAQSRP